MATITLRVDDELKSTMDKLDKVNWSAVMRELLEEEVKKYWIRDRIDKGVKQYEMGKTYSQLEVREMIENWKK